MHSTFSKDPLHIDDIVVYLKNERTGSSTTRKCKFIGQIIDFTDTRVKIRQLSKPDQFCTPEECNDYGEVLVDPHEIVHVVISKHDSIMRALVELNKLVSKYDRERNEANTRVKQLEADLHKLKVSDGAINTKKSCEATMKFVLNGCDILFLAEAPDDITLKQLLKQCDKIHPDWCACGICSYERADFNESHEPEIIIGYDSIRKANDDVSCRIVEEDD